ncbi:hypothetical protein ON010_g16801 [Phytophthora cinnamomi]|nr:hypothetical protein ON010_g16801 [Phytophthora cinnamomi]
MLDDDEERARQRRLTLVQRVFMVLLLLICLASDYFLFQHVYMLDYKLLRHLVDSAAHGSVAFCCWAIFLLQTEKYSAPGYSTFSGLGMLKKVLFKRRHRVAVRPRPFHRCRSRESGWGYTSKRTAVRPRSHFHRCGGLAGQSVFEENPSKEETLPGVLHCGGVVQSPTSGRDAAWALVLAVRIDPSTELLLAPALTEMEKLELALQKADDESEGELGEEANNNDEEEGARLLMSTASKEHSSSPTAASATSPRGKKISEIV